MGTIPDRFLELFRSCLGMYRGVQGCTVCRNTCVLGRGLGSFRQQKIGACKDHTRIYVLFGIDSAGRGKRTHG